MSRKPKIIIGIVIAVVAVLAMLSPMMLPAAILYEAKHTAWTAINKFSEEARSDLNATPVHVSFPQPKPSDPPLEAVRVSSYVIWVPPPQSRKVTGNGDSLDTVVYYPQFHVVFTRPESASEADRVARDAGFKDAFSLGSAVRHIRPKDIDTQIDIAGVKKVELLLAAKLVTYTGPTNFIEYNDRDRCGFIAPVHDKNHPMHAALFLLKSRIICGMYFSNNAGVDLAAVEEFVARVQIEKAGEATQPAASDPAGATTSR